MAFTRLYPPSLEPTANEPERVKPHLGQSKQTPALSLKEQAIERHRTILLDNLHEDYKDGFIKTPEKYIELEAELRKKDLSSHFDEAGNFIDKATGAPVKIDPAELGKEADAAKLKIAAEEAERQSRRKPLIPLEEIKPSTWASSLAEAKSKLSSRVHKNFNSSSPMQSTFTWMTTSLGAMFMLEGLISMIAPKKETVLDEQGNPMQARVRPLMQDVATLAVGAGALATGLFVNIEGKGR